MDIQKPDWYEELKIGPLKTSHPNILQIQNIKRSLVSNDTAKNRLKALTWSAFVMTSLIVCLWLGFTVYQNMLKTHIQQASIVGSSDRQSLQQAVMDFRHFSFMKIEHIEPLNDGVLVFFTRNLMKDGTDLSVEYMRKTFNGWKWVHGGGFGIGDFSHQAVYFEYLNKPDSYIHSHTPFPILYGTFDNEKLNSISVQNGVNVSAKGITFPIAGNQSGWFAYIPENTGTLLIRGIGKRGETVETQKFDPSRYLSGSTSSGTTH